VTIAVISASALCQRRHFPLRAVSATYWPVRQPMAAGGGRDRRGPFLHFLRVTFNGRQSKGAAWSIGRQRHLLSTRSTSGRL